MYSEKDALREVHNETQDYRSPYRRDYARLIHSPSFRRLQGKTQLYPGVESDFFRNRLTHSLEVAQISKTICLFVNHKFLGKGEDFQVDPDICEFAGLAHDLGHPPFGHQGEEALDECMRDFGGFEGNAQTFRILSKIEKKEKDEDNKRVPGKDYRYGLNLTYRSLASILKYDNPIPFTQEDREDGQKEHAIKGYYALDGELVGRIKDHVGWDQKGTFKTIECKIMDIADDIAYSTYDLEDGFKAGFYHPTVFFSYPEDVYENVAKKVTKALKKDDHIDKKDFSPAEVRETLFEIFSSIYSFESVKVTEATNDKEHEYIEVAKGQSTKFIADLIHAATKGSKDIAEDAYFRNKFTSELINCAIEGVVFELNEAFPALSEVYLEEDIRIKVEVLKNFTYESQILSPRLKVAEFRGKEIVKSIFDVIKNDEGWRLMPSDYQKIYHHFTEQSDRLRTICDFIAGMTDRYAIEFYGRLKSENPETIFKPF